MPRVGHQDVYELRYRAQLKALLAPYGLLVEYEDDRAALDLGLHLYESRPDAGEGTVGAVRVWFQCKGLRKATLSAESLRTSPDVAIRDLSIENVRYWYASPEPVYLVVHVEATDDFLAEDVRDIVDRKGGIGALAALVDKRQETMTLRVRSNATLSEALERMPRHRSLRLDGPDFRGRPLGHRYDPLRSELAPFRPEDFDALVRRLLAVHEFRPLEDVAVKERLGMDAGQVTAQIGRLYLTYEWTSPLFTEFGFDPGSDFRIESPPEHAHGEVLVVIHSNIKSIPGSTPETARLLSDLQSRGIVRALVFFNSSDFDARLFGGWRLALDPLARLPQGLASLAFNVLTATTVYLEFIERVRWKYVNYL